MWFATMSMAGAGMVTIYTGAGLGEEEERYPLQSWPWVINFILKRVCWTVCLCTIVSCWFFCKFKYAAINVLIISHILSLVRVVGMYGLNRPVIPSNSNNCTSINVRCGSFPDYVWSFESVITIEADNSCQYLLQYSNDLSQYTGSESFHCLALADVP